MDIDTVRQATEHASLLALGIAFLAGLVVSFNPVARLCLGLSSWPIE
jgi:hypothetical protein